MRKKCCAIANSVREMLLSPAPGCHVMETCSVVHTTYLKEEEIYVKRWSKVQIQAFFRCKINLVVVKCSDRVTKRDKTLTCIMSGAERRACQKRQGVVRHFTRSRANRASCTISYGGVSANLVDMSFSFCVKWGKPDPKK